MKKFVSFLAIILAISALLGGLPAVYKTVALSIRGASAGDRNNISCKTDQRVFDYADVLTDSQETKLERLIAKREKQLGLDIVIVTICENVGSDPYDSSINHTIDFAEDFYSYMGFGYDGFEAEYYMPNGEYMTTRNAGKNLVTEGGVVSYASGSGVIWVDNWYDLNGYAESAFLAYEGTSGDTFYDKAYNTYLYDDNLLELEKDVWNYSNTNPYKSYRRVVNHLASDMVSINLIEVYVKPIYLILVAIVLAFVFVLVNLNRKMGKKTVDKSTYVLGGQAHIVDRRDIFLSKHTTQRHIDTSSSGGGSHHSGGGGGHSGGHSGGGGRH